MFLLGYPKANDVVSVSIFDLINEKYSYWILSSKIQSKKRPILVVHFTFENHNNTLNDMIYQRKIQYISRYNNRIQHRSISVHTS